MNKAQLLKALKRPGPAYAWVNVTQDDGQYVEIVKANLANLVTLNVAQEYQAEVRTGDALYIN